MRILIVGGGIGGCDWKSWEVWKQCERRRPSYGFTRHQSIPSLGVPFAEDSLIHENYITCGQIQSRSEDFTCKHHLVLLWPGLTSHASDVESRICKSDRIPRRLLRRIFRHEFTVWRRRSVDLILIQILTQPCVRQAAGTTLMVRFSIFCGDLVDKNNEQGCLLYFWLLLETNQNVAIWGPGTVQRAFALLFFNICFCQLCSNYVVLHYLFLPPGNSRNFWRPSSL